MGTDTLKIDAADVIVEKFPERAGAELSSFLIESGWEPGRPTEIGLRGLKPELLTSGFFSNFMQKLHDKSPAWCAAAATEITWDTKFEFQQKNIQRWMEPFRRLVMNATRQLEPSVSVVTDFPGHAITNTGRDEDGREIGNCSCGATGVDVDAHMPCSRPQRGQTLQIPPEYANVQALREKYPERPHDLARYCDDEGETIVEVISYPCPPSEDDQKRWASCNDDIEPRSPFPQATIMIRTTPGDPTTIKEVQCWRVDRVPHEDDDGRVTCLTDVGKELKQLVMSWWIFYKKDSLPFFESPDQVNGIINEFLADPIKCDKELSEQYESEEYGPPKLT